MALDFLLLQRSPAPQPRFRHYRWRSPAFTFGYSQKISFVREALAGSGCDPAALDLCRRPTGGGIVDHRDDWTYALVVPRGHPLEEMRASQSYRIVHECLAAGLKGQGVPAEVKPTPNEGGAGPGVCFEAAELFDVVRADTGEKVAGAAQKRNKRGLLLQGSIWRPAAGALDWDRFQRDFAAALSRALGAPAEPAPWPEWDEGEAEGLAEHYASPEWMAFR
jgi:lipoate-protein ligase A